MNPNDIMVPGALLLDQQLTSSAKLLWIIQQVSPGPARMLEARSGLARHTVLAGLAHLQSAPDLTNRSLGWTRMPRDLLLDREIRVASKILYAMLQLTHGFRGLSGRFTYAELSSLTGLCPNTLKRALHELEADRWVRLKRTNKLSPIHFTLRNPVANHREIVVVEAAQRLKEADFAPEAIMKEWLDLIVDCDHSEENAKPSFLVNYFTGQRMEFDRYYPPDVAFEFNGAQHYRATARYPKEAKVRNQMGRDMLKLGICVTRGIKLVVVHASDLTLEGMKRKAGNLLPLRNLDDDAPLIQYLESVSPARKRKGAARL